MTLTARIGADFAKQKLETLIMNKIQKILIIGMVLGLLFQTEKPVHAAIEMPNPIPSILPLDKTKALESYQKRPQCELSKLLYLKDLLQKSAYTVVYNGKFYNPKVIAPIVATYIRLNYKKENAEGWIKKHAYRSRKGNIIYLKDAQGEMVSLKSFLFEELKTLPQLQ